MTHPEADNPRPWWHDPKFIGALAAMAAAILPVTTCVQNKYQSDNELALAGAKQKGELALAMAKQTGELALEKTKQTHAIRQAYLDHVLKNDQQTERVLKFLVKVEEDPNLKAWAEDELSSLRRRVKTKKQLYRETIDTVSNLASSNNPGDENSEDFQNFWRLYKGPLIPVESTEVATLMVEIGRLLNNCKSGASCDKDKIQKLSFKLSLTVKQELQGSPSESE
jgi:hypothetical protein